MAESTLFKTTSANQTVDVLLLVENSQAMSIIWDDLRDRYLDMVMARLKGASEPASNDINVWVLESQSLQGSSTTEPRQYRDPHHAIRQVCLNYLVENRISSCKVNAAIDFLSGLKSKSGHEARSLHLIIVAASSPVDTGLAVTNKNGATELSNWGYLAHKLAQDNIHCHTLTRSREDMTPLTTLFNDTLHLQRNIEDLASSFPIDPEVSLRLSMAATASDHYQSYVQVNPPPRPTRIMMPPRRNTFPLDTCYTDPHHTDAQYAPTPPEMEPSPTLVTQLQQVHGLTKKKVYGAKPQQQPFCSEERYDEQNRNERVAISLSMGLSDGHAPQLPPASGRVQSLSRIDRMARNQAGPTDVKARRNLGWSGRGSRVSSPDSDPLRSPTSVAGYTDISPATAPYMTSALSSPVSPASLDEYYGAHSASTTLVSTPAPDPTWLHNGYPSIDVGAGHDLQTSYFAPSHTLPSPTYQDIPIQGGYVGHAYGDSSPVGEIAPLNIHPTFAADHHKGFSVSGAVSPTASGALTYPAVTPPAVSHISVPSVVYPPPPHPPPSSAIATSTSPREVPSPPSVPELPIAPSIKPTTKKSKAAPLATANAAPAASKSKSKSKSKSSTPTRKSYHKPENDEYFELDQSYVEATTNLFNEYFPNASATIPEKSSGTHGSSNGSIKSLSASSARDGYIQGAVGGSTTEPGSPISASTALSPSGTSTLPAFSSSGPQSVDKAKYTSLKPKRAEDTYPLASASPVHSSLSSIPAVTPILLEPHGHLELQPGPIPVMRSYQYPSRGTSSLTHWAG
ncbi:hypothetical protein FA15DRAFT_687476 [Coprinopsis marcescibilis]|uniref:Uncharacterized protein n=1 Tax=Coprinopsis marcescibilis TaxID=230819 RepID=A0A5C3KVB8_COPMA|nr:hypothetical protein FA15DRAFT_687476 [Coprinopsis marcescibilis]